jgi:hypothetical protein
MIEDWAVAHADSIRTWLSSAGVLAALGLVAKLVRWAWQEYHGRGRLVLIKRSDDPLVGWIEDVQQRIFPEDECDPRGVLGRRIDESNFSMFGRARSDTSMIALVYLKRKTPVAYLSAQYFPQQRTIFFWYIFSLRGKRMRKKLSDMAINWEDVDAVKEKVSTRLLGKLLAVCDRGTDWRYLVAEVDDENLGEARNKISAFQRLASDMIAEQSKHPLKRWFRRGPPADLNERVFKVDIPFKMPLHDPDLIERAREHEASGWLVFAPRSKAPFKNGKGYAIESRIVRDELLNALITLGYHNSENDEYNAYIDAFFQRLTADLPERIALIANPKLMTKAGSAFRPAPVGAQELQHRGGDDAERDDADDDGGKRVDVG